MLLIASYAFLEPGASEVPCLLHFKVFMQIPPAQQDFNHHLIQNLHNNEVFIEPVTCCLLGP